MKIALLAGDGIGPEIMREAVTVLDVLRKRRPSRSRPRKRSSAARPTTRTSDPLPAATLDLAKQSDAVLFGAVGGPQYDKLDRATSARSARSWACARSATSSRTCARRTVFPELADASTLKPEVVSGLDIMIVRELTGRHLLRPAARHHGREGPNREGFNTMRYTEAQIRRILHVGFKTARRAASGSCSVDKMNVLETTQLWRDIADRDRPGVPGRRAFAYARG